MTSIADANQAREHDSDAQLVQALLASPRFCRLVATAAPEILDAMAGDGRLKRMVARYAGRHIQSRWVARAQQIAENQPGSLRMDTAVSALMVNLTVDFANQSLAGCARLSTSEKKALLTHWIEQLDTAGVGRALTAILQMVHGEGIHSNLLRDKLTAFWKATDVGELPDAIAVARERLLPLWEEALAITWSYPSKVVCLLAALPSLAGLALDLAARGLAPFNRLPPDMLADVIVALIRDLDTRSVGALVNQGTEIVRKLHAGSTLIGSPGKPELPHVIDSLTDAIFDTADQAALAAARNKAGVLTEALAEKRVERLERQPGWNANRLKANVKNVSRQVRAMERQVRCWEALSPDETLADTVAEGLADLDTGELADVCNRSIGLFTRVMNVRPELVSSLVRCFAEEIDTEALIDCLALAAPQPATDGGIGDLAAPLLHSLADKMEADPDSELAGAMRRLGRLMSA